MKAEKMFFTHQVKLLLLSLSVLLIFFILLFMLWRIWFAELHFLFENPFPHETLFEEVGSGSATGSGISMEMGILYPPTIAISPAGFPYVAWVKREGVSPPSNIYLLQGDGSRWSEVGMGSARGGGISNTTRAASSPSIDFAPDGTLYLAWSEDGAIYVKQWDGHSWEEVGQGSASGKGISIGSGDSSRPSLTVDANNIIYVAWESIHAGSPQIHIKRWAGGQWEEVGLGSATGHGISNTTTAVAPQVEVDSMGQPYVVWADTSTGEQLIYIRRWNGHNWEEVGPGSASGRGLGTINGPNGEKPDFYLNIGPLKWPDDFPSLAIAPDSTPYVIWPYYDGRNIAVRRWNNAVGKWESIDLTSKIFPFEGNFFEKPTISISPDNIPYLAWTGIDGAGSSIYLRRWNGHYWEEVISGSARANGIAMDDTLGDNAAAMAFAPDGTLYVTWLVVIRDPSAASSANVRQAIYVRQWHPNP